MASVASFYVRLLLYLHFGIGGRPKLILRLLTVEIALEVGKRDLVTRLILTILLTLFLDGVVGEVDHLVRQILEVEFLACRADVPFLKPVALSDAVGRCQADVCSDVELSLVIEERHNVLLKNVSTRPAHRVCLFFVDEVSNLLQRLSDGNAGASVGILTGFHQPDVATLAGLEGSLLGLFLLVDDELLLLAVVLHELHKLLAVEILDVERHWNKIEGVDFACLVVALHVIKQSFFVAEVPVVLEVVVDRQPLGILDGAHLVAFGGFDSSVLQQCADLLQALHVLLREYSP